ncbi:MAG: hypothetical protein PHT13_02265, partial [Methanosarcina sp.]|nr:hypothetical protein [Methanosarcina sp.]
RVFKHLSKSRRLLRRLTSLQLVDFPRCRELYSKLSEKYPDFMYLHFLMGAIHISIDPVLAKSCFERTLEMAEKDENVPETILESLRLNISSLEEQL